MLTLTHYLVLAGILFFIGAVIVLTRHSAVVSLMGVELMLNSCNLMLVTFSNMQQNLEGQMMAFFIMVVAAAEVVVGLGIVIAMFRTRRTTSVDEINLLGR